MRHTFCRFAHRWGQVPASLVLLLALLAAPALAAAQTDDERARARTEFERGVAAYEGQRFQEALDAFQEAYRLAPHPSVRLNIAHCYEQLDRPVEALFHFEHYLTEASSVAGAQRREIDATMRGLRRRVGTITLQVTPDGAQIVIDGTETRRAPVSEPVRVTAGDHTVVVSLEGYASETQTVHVEGGSDARVALRLRRAEAAAVATTTVEAGAGGGAMATTVGTETETRTEVVETVTVDTDTDVAPDAPGEPEGSGGGIRITTPTIVVGAITLAAAAAWGITGGLALAENGAFEADVVRANDTTLSEAARAEARTSGLGHADTARTLAITSDVLMVATLVGIGSTTFFFVLAQTEGEEPESPTVMVLPVVAPTPDGGVFTGASAGGRF